MVITEEVIKLLFDTGGKIEEAGIEEGISWDTLEELLIVVAVDTILGGENGGRGTVFSA